jgi:hypothetical protein
VSGTWDFVGVLFAASGMLLLGGPAILTGLYQQWRLSWLLGQTRYLQGIGEHWSFWISLWLIYAAIIGGGSAWLLRRRARFTSIYNVEPEAFAEVFSEVLKRLGLDWLRRGPHRLVIRLRDPAFAVVQDPLRVADAAEENGPPWAELVLDPFPAMRHVTLRWRGSDDPVRREVEAELIKALAEVRTRQNPLGIWFLSLALALFFAAFLTLFALVALRLLQFTL